MQIINKAKITAIIFVILMMTSSSLLAMPVNAQPAHGGAPAANGSILLPAGVTPDMTIDDTVVVTVNPHVVGVGQAVLINLWMEPAVSLTRYLTGYKVTLTKPDGTTDVFTLNSFQGDSTAWLSYVPDKVGAWKVDFTMPGGYFPAGNYTVPLGISGIAGAGGVPYMESFTRSLYYAPATAQQQTFTVQSDMVASWPPAPLPTDYWTRPIPFENREWSQISGDYPWFGPGSASINGYTWPANTNYYYSPQYQFTPYVTGPTSAHILWKRPGPLGSTSGIVGGAYGTRGSTTGGGGPNIIYQGRCYQTYSSVLANSDTSVTRWQCYDLRTGQVYWDRPLIPASGTIPGESAPTAIEYATGAVSTPGAEFSTGLTASLVAINGPTNVATYPGAQDQGGYIYNSLTTATPGTMVKYNPLTGAVTTNITLPLPPLGESMYYMNGYVISLQTVNTTGGPGLPGTPTSGQYRLINWTTIGSGNFASRIVSNISFPNAALGTIPGLSVGTQEDFATGMYFLAKEANFFDLGNMGSPYVCVTNNLNPLAAVNNYGENDNASGFRLGTAIEGISMTTGQVLFLKFFNDLTNPLADTAFSGSAVVADHGKLAVAMRDGTFSVFDEMTGALLFKTEAVTAPWDITGFGAYGIASAYGMFYYGRYSQFVAYDWNNGNIVWKFEAPSQAAFESPYSDANGTEVYPWYSGSAQVAGGMVYIYNAEHSTTQPVTRGWRLWCLNATTGQEIWDITTPGSISAIADGYISVSATDGYQYVFGIGKSATTVSAPDTVVPKGTGVVIKGTVLDMSPAQSGTPCVSKNSMRTQMEYLHRQQPIDGLWHNETITGVPVSLTAIRSDGTYVDIGIVTSDGYHGTFSKSWTPPEEGDYNIIASFVGDESYGSSSAATGISVGPAPATPSTPEIPTPVDYNPLLYGILAAVVVAIVLALVAIFRKK